MGGAYKVILRVPDGQGYVSIYVVTNVMNKEILSGKMIEHKCTTQYILLLLLSKVHLSSSTFVKHRFPKYSCTYCTYMYYYYHKYVRLFNKQSMMRI